MWGLKAWLRALGPSSSAMLRLRRAGPAGVAGAERRSGLRRERYQLGQYDAVGSYYHTRCHVRRRTPRSMKKPDSRARQLIPFEDRLSCPAIRSTVQGAVFGISRKCSAQNGPKLRPRLGEKLWAGREQSSRQHLRSPLPTASAAARLGGGSMGEGAGS